jgi:hypothetical protein
MQPHPHNSERLLRGMMTRPFGLMILALSLLVTTAWAAEPVKISSLQTYPEAYKMKVVQVEGTVSGYQMDHLAI